MARADRYRETSDNNGGGRRRKGGIRRAAENVIMICLVLIVLVSGYKIYTILHDYDENQGIYDDISVTAQEDGFTGDIDFDSLRQINPDIVGWLYYEDTLIDYPIVQGEDNDKYLHTMFDGTYSGFGTLFVDAITEDAFNQFNTIVYGHHMLNGSMFGDIKKLKDTDYCKAHPQFELVTPEGRFHLRICAFLNQPSDSAVYTTNFHDRDDMQAYIDLIISHSLYITTEEMSPDDRLLVLSTCAYEYQDARYMVVAKMIPWD